MYRRSCIVFRAQSHYHPRCEILRRKTAASSSNIVMGDKRLIDYIDARL